MLFHNAKSYDNSYILDIFNKIENIKIKALGQNQDKFKMIEFRIPGKDYSLKIIDSLAFLQESLDELSKELHNELKIMTKKHYEDEFELVNKKLESFPYNYLKTENLIENLPDKKESYYMLKMFHVDKNDYNKVEKFYKELKFKNLKEYLQCYLTSDITLLADCFLNFRQSFKLSYYNEYKSYLSSMIEVLQMEQE